MMNDPDLSEIRARLRAGCVIPAHPLALTSAGKFDERCQRAITRYYLAAGANALAVGVHTTQFQIRERKHGLLHPVLQLAAQTVAESDALQTIMIAGICGSTDQAVGEAETAKDLGYQVGLLSLADLQTASDDELVQHCESVASVIPIFGFYLQPAVGGRVLSVDFWRRLARIENLVGVKVSPFDRYKTLDVARGIAEAGRQHEVALYTGNDDSIVIDLLTEYQIVTQQGPVQLSFSGGLLGHWACWTKAAVDLLCRCQSAKQEAQIPSSMLTLANEVTDCNAALFDAANGFAGCIAGIQYVLHRQGLLSSTRLLNPAEGLSPGQAQEIERVRRAYPHLLDDEFVAQHRDNWLS